MSPSIPLTAAQSLHGYDRGHRLLHCSIELDDASRSQMLVLSDLLSSSELNPGDSYLTAYPLIEAQRFVIARTWGAGIGYRPGSVWTHSLILDYQTLARVHDLLFLVNFLRPPELGRLDIYENDIEISEYQQSKPAVELDSRAPEAIAQLYSSDSAHDLVLPTANAISNELLALQLWRQMWPAMRRFFAFMTTVGKWPNEVSFPCSLRYTKAENVKPSQINRAWQRGFNLLLSDLPESGPTEFRSYLARYVIESQAPRSAVLPLATLFSLREDSAFEDRIHVYQFISNTFNTQRLARDYLTTEIEKARSVDDIVALIKILDDVKFKVNVRKPLADIGKMSNYELRAILDVSVESESDEFGGQIFSSVVQGSSPENLAAAVDERTRLKVAIHRPDIIDEPSFWPSLDVEKINLFDQLTEFRNFDVEWAWRLFGPQIPIEILNKILFDCHSLSHGILQIILNGDQERQHILATWLFSKAEFFSDFTQKVEFVSEDLLSILASAQIHNIGRMCELTWWARNLLKPTVSIEQGKRTSNLITLGFTTAILSNGNISRELGIKYFSLAIYAANKYYFSSTEEGFLLRELKTEDRYYSLRKKLIKIGLNRWPISEDSAGLLGLTSDTEIVDLVLEEIDYEKHRSSLLHLQKSSELTENARFFLTKFLQSKNKPRMFPWFWM